MKISGHFSRPMAFMLFFVVCLGFTSVNCQNNAQLPKLAGLESFHSRVTWMIKENSVVEPRRRYVEEYFSKKRGRARLNIQNEAANDAISVIWYQDLRQIVYVEGNECNTFDIDNQQHKGNLTNLLSDYGYNNITELQTNVTVFGPSVLWRRVIENQEKAKKQNLSIDDSTVRGIYTQVWVLKLDDKRYTLYLTESKWKKFENMTGNINIPVRLTIEQEQNQRAEQLDFYVFEEYTPSFVEFSLPKGIGCKGKKNPKNVQLLAPKWDTFYSQWELYDLMSDDTTPVTSKIFYDKKRMVVRYDFDLIGSTTVIHDLARDIVYIKDEDGKCSIKDIISGDDGAFGASLKKTQSIVTVFDLDGDVYFAGRATVRGIFCDVWEKVKLNVDYASEQYSKLVLTFYFNTRDVKMIDDDNDSPVPVRIIRTGYKLINGTSTVLLKEEENYFNFQPMYVGRSFNQFFNIRNCDKESEKEQYYILSATAEQNLTQFPSRYRIRVARQVQDALLDKLETKLQVSQLRIPYINIDVADTEVTAEVMIKEKPAAIASFKTVEKQKPRLGETPQFSLDAKACAEATFNQDGAIGFKYCAGSCRVMTNDTEKTTVSPKASLCDVYILGNLAKTPSELSNEPNLEFLQKRLFDLASEKSLSVGVKVRGKEINVKVTDATAGQSPIEQFRTRELYILTLPYQLLKLTDQKTVEDVPVESFGDCYLSCKNADTMDCQSISYCSVGDDLVCRISSSLTYKNMTKSASAALTEANINCSTYSMAYLQRYQKEPGLFELFQVGQPRVAETAEECAKWCATDKSKKCASFQYCEGKSCMLSNSSIVDLRKQELVNIKKGSRKTSCELYAQRHVEEFVRTGVDLVTEVFATVAADDVETCAKQCFDDAQREYGKFCLSFNFCPISSKQVNGLCELSEFSPRKANVKTKRNRLCQNYERKPQTSKIPKSQKTYVEDTSGMSGGLFYGLMFTMLFVGILLSVAGFVLLMVYQKHRDPESTGFGLSVRFVRQQDSDD